ncbi:MAG: hypothetical protein FP824_06055 [Euryarchaeota archaeon]|nr:hypothetical protein [Euryarchaeota archaeon]MBU4032967.1 right-handed parallel beta-helix repeat-containing protein [Candidatus Thermoplasmatota archaeon]
MRKLNTIVLVTILLLSSVVIFEFTKSTAYIGHDSILITSNKDFITQGWPGNGTYTNPYRIENISIKTNRNSAPIQIQNTTSYFIIQSCYIRGGGGEYPGGGIRLKNVRNGILKNNTCEKNDNGIYLWSSGSIILDNNTCKDNDRAGIWQVYSSGIKITYNILYGNGYAGLDIEGSSNTITHNYFGHNEGTGISIHLLTNGNSICYNEFRENEEGSIIISGSAQSGTSGNRIHHNNFISTNNEGSLVWDSSNNYWYDSINEIGNYWANYEVKYPPSTNNGSVWDTPYDIPGGDNKDEYPLVNPIPNLAPEFSDVSNDMDYQMIIIICIIVVSVCILILLVVIRMKKNKSLPPPEKYT